MSENLIVYCGTKYGKAKKKLIEREARERKYRSTAQFIWDAIADKLTPATLVKLRAMEKLEDGR